MDFLDESTGGNDDGSGGGAGEPVAFSFVSSI